MIDSDVPTKFRHGFSPHAGAGSENDSMPTERKESAVAQQAFMDLAEGSTSAQRAIARAQAAVKDDMENLIMSSSLVEHLLTSLIVMSPGTTRSNPESPMRKLGSRMCRLPPRS